MLGATITLWGVELEENLALALGSILFLAVWMGLGLLIKAFVFGRLRALAARTDTRIDDLVLKALNVPIVLMLLAGGVLALVRLLPVRMSSAELYHILLVILVIAGVLFADRVLRGVITLYADKVEIFRTAGGLVQSCARGAVLIVGALVMLGTMGVNVTPILASLGVGSLAVALALQPTLENFLAGIQVVTDRQFMEGHFIRLESGEEGWVEKINMRATWLRTPQGNMVIFPNKLLVATRITNYYYPNKEMDLPIPVGVHYDSDLEHVERVLREVAAETIAQAEGAVRTFTPVIRFTALADSSVTTLVIIRVEEFTKQGLVRNDFFKRLLPRLRKEGIVIPYPVRAVNLSQEKASFGKAS